MIKWGLNIKFICYTVFIVVFISLVFSSVFIFQSRQALFSEFNNRAQSLVKNLARNIEVPLLIENKAALMSLAENLMAEKDVQSVLIVNQQSDVMVSLKKGGRLLPWQKKTISCPVYFAPEPQAGAAGRMEPFFDGGDNAAAGRRVLGTVETVFSRTDIIKTLFRIRWWIFIAATAAAVIGGIAAFYFSRTIIMPVQRLAQATYSIARGNWEEKLEVTRSDELGSLTESFNIMAHSLVEKRRELEKTYRELTQKEKMAEIGKFSMIIAHELKNPLGIIKGSVDILSKPDIKPEIRDTMISYILEEIQRLNKLIDDFLSFARPMPPRTEPASVNDIVKKLARHFTVREEDAKDIALQTDLGQVPAIELDENQIYQALFNLVTNAAQAIEKKGSIRIATGVEGDAVTITVADTGRGLDDEIRDRLFEPFVTSKAKGTGLGLAIVEKYVNNHSGSVRVGQNPGGGTAFVISLPIDES